MAEIAWTVSPALRALRDPSLVPWPEAYSIAVERLHTSPMVSVASALFRGSMPFRSSYSPLAYVCPFGQPFHCFRYFTGQ
jgi:hypothetical protein